MPNDELKMRLGECRSHGHTFPNVDLTKDSDDTCQRCETRRVVKSGRVTYYAPPELTKYPLGEVK